MRFVRPLLALLASIGLTTAARAQEFAPRSGAPRARTGFQMALRTGASIPMGKADGASGGDMSNSFAWQVPLFVEIGGKPNRFFFIGGYLGLGFGGTAGDLQAFCSSTATTCTAISVRGGIEFQYHSLPDSTANPWIGYGIGYESAGVSMTSGGRTGSISDNGFEFANFMGGVDFRLSRTFGIGPFLSLSIGQYRKFRSEILGRVTEEGDIAEKATHEWLSAGARFVFFP
jgi:hypothetical protein